VATWTEFAAAAPRIAGIFVRRHAAAGNLCMLATLRPDGFPRISPMEPRTFDHFFATHLVGAAAVEVGDGHMDVTVWRDGAAEHVVRKH
jgi:hypothetical protein